LEGSLSRFSAQGLSKLSMQERAAVGRGYLLDLNIAGELAAHSRENGGGGVVVDCLGWRWSGGGGLSWGGGGMWVGVGGRREG